MFGGKEECLYASGHRLLASAGTTISPLCWPFDTLAMCLQHVTSPRFRGGVFLSSYLHNLVAGSEQQVIAPGSRAKITIGWGLKDRVCLPRQAARALERFPDARLHWFEDCGHFSMWERPEETLQVILNNTG